MILEFIAAYAIGFAVFELLVAIQAALICGDSSSYWDRLLPLQVLPLLGPLYPAMVAVLT